MPRTEVAPKRRTSGAFTPLPQSAIPTLHESRGDSLSRRENEIGDAGIDSSLHVAQLAFRIAAVLELITDIRSFQELTKERAPSS